MASAVRLRRSHLGGAHYRACCHCGRPTRAEALTLDHILPRSRGGRLTKANTALACSPCNNERGSMDFWVFRERKRAEVVGHPVDLKHEAPTREQWRLAHENGAVRKRRKRVQRRQPELVEGDHAWWLLYKEPTPRDPL